MKPSLLTSISGPGLTEHCGVINLLEDNDGDVSWRWDSSVSTGLAGVQPVV